MFVVDTIFFPPQFQDSTERKKLFPMGTQEAGCKMEEITSVFTKIIEVNMNIYYNYSSTFYN